MLPDGDGFPSFLFYIFCRCIYLGIFMELSVISDKESVFDDGNPADYADRIVTIVDGVLQAGNNVVSNL